MILGIWGYSSDAPAVEHHDSGAALIVDGKITAALNEERITRRKNEGRWPEASIDEVLHLSGVSPSEVEAVAMAGLSPLARGAEMAKELFRNYRATGQILSNRWIYALLTAKKWRRRGPKGFTENLSFISHHLAHAASAYYTSPFEDCAVLTLDGIGDSSHCGGIFKAEGGTLTPVRLFSGYASIGILYSHVTKAFGFRPARHEGKITGLAGFGDPDRLIGEFRSKLRYRGGRLESDFIPALFRNRVDAQWETDWIDELLERNSREDIAAALQRHTEELCTAIAKDALRETGMRDIALGGGVFANVRVNQEIAKVTPGGLFIHPNMGDGGLGLGAALALHGERVPLPDVYLGSPVHAPRENELPSGVEAWRPEPREVAGAVARACARNLVVGYADGRMEYGPRALGNRTIFVSAENPEINDTLNQRLKRTEFMPFAPIMTEDAARRYLRGWDESHVPARFMTITYDVTEECRRDAAAIVHVDGTARPQIVSPSAGRLHDILVEYGRLTGREILINTSFNIHEEPIVRSGEDALRSYLQGAVDLLVVDGVLFAAAPLLKSLGTPE